MLRAPYDSWSASQKTRIVRYSNNWGTWLSSVSTPKNQRLRNSQRKNKWSNRIRWIKWWINSLMASHWWRPHLQKKKINPSQPRIPIRWHRILHARNSWSRYSHNSCRRRRKSRGSRKRRLLHETWANKARPDKQDDSPNSKTKLKRQTIENRQQDNKFSSSASGRQQQTESEQPKKKYVLRMITCNFIWRNSQHL